MSETPILRPEPYDATLTAVVTTLAARKAERLVIVDLRDKASFTDFFVICHGTSDRQVRSLADEVIDTVKQQTGRRPVAEGLGAAEWILLDYGDFLVHLFNEPAREFYRLESLWADAPRVDPARFGA